MVKASLLCLMFIAPILFTEEPWDLRYQSPKQCAVTISPWLFLIHCHQQYLSPTTGPRSHFLPTSSEYTRQAIVAWGPSGVVLGFDRLLRENNERWIYKKIKGPAGYVKWDPVPLPH